MSKTTYKGIDYSLGQSNVDEATGIHYGVINQQEVCQAWYDSSEPYYGEPHCPKCGNDAVGEQEVGEDGNAVDRSAYERGHGSHDFACDDCEYLFDGDEAYGDESVSHSLDDGEYLAEAGEDGDIFIVKSPYYTKCQYCSPCAPGAGYLMNPCEDGVKSFCFDHSWFNDNVAPYPVYRVADDSVVEAEKKA